MLQRGREFTGIVVLLDFKFDLTNYYKQPSQLDVNIIQDKYNNVTHKKDIRTAGFFKIYIGKWGEMGPLRKKRLHVT